MNFKPEIDRQWNDSKGIRISFMGVLGCEIVDVINDITHLERDDPDYWVILGKLKLLLETRNLLDESVGDSDEQ